MPLKIKFLESRLKFEDHLLRFEEYRFLGFYVFEVKVDQLQESINETYD